MTTPRCQTQPAKLFTARVERAKREAQRYQVIGPLSRARKLRAACERVIAARGGK